MMLIILLWTRNNWVDLGSAQKVKTKKLYIDFAELAP